jgi:hypothetical protein
VDVEDSEEGQANKLLRLGIPMMKLSLWKLLRCRIGLNAR